MLRNLFLPIFKLALLLSLFIIPASVYARVNPNDIYLAKVAEFQTGVSKIQNPQKKQLVLQANQMLKDLNQQECSKFDTDVNRMAAILDEEKSRQHITKTVVAYGQGNTPIDTAEYYLNYAEEALAYQKAQDYTPDLSGGNLSGGVSNSLNNLNSDLQTLQAKVLKAKSEVQIALDYYEK